MGYFTALKVPEEFGIRLKNIDAPLKDAMWTHIDDLHVTLKYLGDASPEQVEAFLEAVRPIRTPPLDVRVRGLTVFPHVSSRLLVANVDITPQLKKLRDAHEAAAVKLGLEPHPFPVFQPHITLARYDLTQPKTEMHVLDRYAGFEMDFSGPEIGLYRSVRPTTSPIERYELVERLR